MVLNTGLDSEEPCMVHMKFVTASEIDKQIWTIAFVKVECSSLSDLSLRFITLSVYFSPRFYVSPFFIFSRDIYVSIAKRLLGAVWIPSIHSDQKSYRLFSTLWHAPGIAGTNTIEAPRKGEQKTETRITSPSNSQEKTDTATLLLCIQQQFKVLESSP